MPSDARTPGPNAAHLARARDALAAARRVVVLTGAGVSAESRIPTFREAAAGLAAEASDPDTATTMQALWKEFDPQKLATPEAYAADPAMVSRWYDWRRLKCAAAEPNPGHLALAALQRSLETRTTPEGLPGSLTLLTQNVDGLHQRAGSTGVIELHGSLFAWRGLRTARPYALPAPPHPFPEFPPRLPDGEIARPGVVWFGEMLPEAALEASYEALAACDVFMSVGTSAVVWPAAGFVQIAARAGATTIEINPGPTAITHSVDISLRGPSGVVLPSLIA